MNMMTISMPFVSECKVSECAYNVNNSCHAKAITIGDGVHPGCDTFFGTARHTRDAARTAGIGACKVIGCKFNDDYECMADHISVGRVGDSVECLTCTN